LAILAGIDEAGFGPVLGPLAVTGVAFRVPDAQLGRCLWKTLCETCTDRSTRAGRRLVITDSKKLYRSRGSLGPLERAALVMLAAGGHRPSSWRALLDLVAPEASGVLDQYTWYRNTDIPLPLGGEVGDVGTQANAVRKDGRDHGIELVGVCSELLPAGHFNRLVRNTRNKAVVLLGLILRVVDRIMRSAPGERVRLYVDRLGGRTHYRDALMAALGGYDLYVLEESPTRSAYRLVRSSRTCEVAFVTGGDARHFPVALASVYSKYLRELQMHVFNKYWCGQIEGLRPTAGYYTDAQRWLQEAAAGINCRSVDRGMLVRQR
jgi:ribonuclease HII